ncbi:hypothetical protein D9619_013274 [Psilocybe cf. subviscida]|uniref:GPI-anchored wall transfer protein 1 n=1 Tax=Psilocybe cf. subviscida TaxID=2480587 RepID=A0A8H5F9G5_9AGAR|nr:hypothetical protein D9619_013274 [Psilocybe cf. subviscida]
MSVDDDGDGDGGCAVPGLDVEERQAERDQHVPSLVARASKHVEGINHPVRDRTSPFFLFFDILFTPSFACISWAAVALHAALTTRISAFSAHQQSLSSSKHSRSRSRSPHASSSPRTDTLNGDSLRRKRRRHPPGPGLLVSYATLVLPLLLSMTLFALASSSLFSFFPFSYLSATQRNSRGSYTDTNANANNHDWSLWPPFLLSVLLGIPAVVILLVKERLDMRFRGALPVRSPVRPTASRGRSSVLTAGQGSSSTFSGLDEKSMTDSRFKENPKINEKPRIKIKSLSALTTYRSHMMLMTVLAVLAVDFRVFPRALAKCESWGVGLMDLGVGSFVFSQGIVSARSFLLEPFSASSSTSSVNPLTSVLSDTTSGLRKSLPLLVLGLARLVLVKASDYPEHVAEYGTHWNFFLTLAAVAVGQVVVVRGVSGLLGVVGGVFNGKRSIGGVVGPGPMVMGMGVALGQYILLHPRGLGFEPYVLSDTPRTTLLFSASLRQIIDSNREGLVSLPGYLAIHLLGMAAGAIVLPPTPGVYRKRTKVLKAINVARQQGETTEDMDAREKVAKALEEYRRALSGPRELDKTATELGGQVILWWGLLGLVWVLGLDPEGISRRLVNFSYILWVAAFNTAFLLAYIVVLDLGIYASPSSSAYDNPYIEPTPPAVRKHRAPFGPDKAPTNGRTLGGEYPRHGGNAREDDELEKDDQTGNPPRLLAAINHHGLSVFLLANVLTGLINLSIHSTRVGDAAAIMVLIAYSFALSAVAWVMY